MPSSDYKPLKVGEVVWGNGWGAGKIIKMGVRYENGEISEQIPGKNCWALLETKSTCECERCGDRHSLTETRQLDLMHVRRMR